MFRSIYEYPGFEKFQYIDGEIEAFPGVEHDYDHLLPYVPRYPQWEDLGRAYFKLGFQRGDGKLTAQVIAAGSPETRTAGVGAFAEWLGEEQVDEWLPDFPGVAADL